MSDAVRIVWFKRDLRIRDHRPLYEAAQHAAVIPLYIIEPTIIHAPDYDKRHYQFIEMCLHELRESLYELGQPLVIRIGEAVDVFEQLCSDYPLQAIHAHEETGNMITYMRDMAVHRWARAHGIPFIETPNNGVIRVLKDRDKRIKLWRQRVTDPEIVPIPPRLDSVEIEMGEIPSADSLNLHDEGITQIQAGGEAEAHRVLQDFLYRRGAMYHKEMSSPVTADESCSRISPHLAYGTISMRQTFDALHQRREELNQMHSAEYEMLDGEWKKAMRAFESRLHWHDHFIQKLEDEPRIEYESFVPAYDTLRDHPALDAEAARRFEAFTTGNTGFPMVDACIRSLIHTGWINFRMRAMLVSFASYDLWLKWQQTGIWLARVFTDYEPGIHYSQTQMQSGTTGINTLRVYNPTKQGKDHDKQGDFIRHWIPELGLVPKKYIHQPELMPDDAQEEFHCIIGRDYPAPIVEHKIAVQASKDRIWELRKQPEVKAVAEQVLERHGSRKRG